MYARVGVKTNDEWATIQRRSFLLLLFFSPHTNWQYNYKQTKQKTNKHNHTKHNTHTHTYTHTFIRSCACRPFCYLKPCKLVNIIQPCTLHLLPGSQLFWFLTSQLVQFHFFLDSLPTYRDLAQDWWSTILSVGVIDWTGLVKHPFICGGDPLGFTYTWLLKMTGS